MFSTMKQWYRAYEHVHDSRHCIEDSEDEKLFVAKANTVIQPRIVVVHTQHTLTTAGAMLTSTYHLQTYTYLVGDCYKGRSAVVHVR